MYKTKNNPLALKIFSLFALAATFFVAYHLLLDDNCLHASISSVIGSSHQMALSRHLFVLGLLPIYIALIIFGAGMLGIYVGLKIEHFIVRLIKNPHSTAKNKA